MIPEEISLKEKSPSKIKSRYNPLHEFNFLEDEKEMSYEFKTPLNASTVLIFGGQGKTQLKQFVVVTEDGSEIDLKNMKQSYQKNDWYRLELPHNQKIKSLKIVGMSLTPESSLKIVQQTFK